MKVAPQSQFGNPWVLFSGRLGPAPKHKAWQAQQEPCFSPNRQVALCKAQSAPLLFTTALFSSFQPPVLCLWWLPLTHPYHSGFLVLSPKSPLMFSFGLLATDPQAMTSVCWGLMNYSSFFWCPVIQPWLQQKRKGRSHNSQLYKLIFIKGDNVRSGETVYTIL